MVDSPFEGRQVRLRAFEPDDMPAVGTYLRHYALIGRRYLPWGFSDYTPLSGQQVTSIVSRWTDAEKRLSLAVEHVETGQIIGHAEGEWDWDPHTPSVAVVIGPSWQRQGYGSAALSLMLGYLFDYTPAHVVTCWLADWNVEGRAFARAHGFQESGLMRRAGQHDGRFFDLVVMDQLRREWRERRAGRREGGADHAS